MRVRRGVWLAGAATIGLLAPPVFATGNPQITFGFGDFHEVKRDPEYPAPSNEQLSQRQARLDAGPVKRLYHQTSPDSARAILNSGEMKRGSSGLAGGGIYFATSPAHTDHKALAKGVILECEVRLGAVHTTQSSGDSSLSFRKLLNMDAPRDSVLIPRKNGVEFVVYNTDQVRVIGPANANTDRWWRKYF